MRLISFFSGIFKGGFFIIYFLFSIYYLFLGFLLFYYMEILLNNIYYVQHEMVNKNIPIRLYIHTKIFMRAILTFLTQVSYFYTPAKCIELGHWRKNG